jgi:hypothetical protein
MLILSVFYYWLLVSALKGHHQANIYPPTKKNLKMLVHIVQRRRFYGNPLKFISGLYNYYQPSDVLSVVRWIEILYFEYYGCYFLNFH